MTILHCNQCGHEYASSEIIGKVVTNSIRYIKIEHKCPRCDWRNETLFGTERVVKEIIK